MPTHKRGYEVAINNYAWKDVPQPKKLRKQAAEKSSLITNGIKIISGLITRSFQLATIRREQKDDPIAETLCQPARQMKILSKLPYDLLVEIAKRLKTVEDFTCFRCVSRSMHLSVKEEYFQGLRLRKSLPYLMLPPDCSNSRDGNNDIQRRQFYSLLKGESIVASLEFPAFKTSSKMYYESLGWLLSIEVDGSMSLLDPFSNIEIPLPHLLTFPGLEMLVVDKRILVRKMVLSSRPNEDSDFIMMVIMGDCGHLAFWRFGEKAWNKIHDRKGVFMDVVYGGGEEFYATSTMGVVWVINFAGRHVECRILLRSKPLLGVRESQGQYILKAINGSMLIIIRTRDKKFSLSSEFQVYDIDIGTGIWKEIYSLGRMAVFLGRNSSFAVDATAPSIGGVIKANHIYFTDDFFLYQSVYFRFSNWTNYAGGSRYAKGGSVDSGVFNFETGDIEPIYPVEPLSMNVCPAMWITPNLPEC